MRAFLCGLLHGIEAVSSPSLLASTLFVERSGGRDGTRVPTPTGSAQARDAALVAPPEKCAIADPRLPQVVRFRSAFSGERGGVKW
jgi:hypothetical protein